MKPKQQGGLPTPDVPSAQHGARLTGVDRWGAEIPQTCEAFTIPTQTVCGDSNEPPTKDEKKAREAYVKE